MIVGTCVGCFILIAFATSVCAVAALCYAEMASMVPVSGSAYTYSYAVMGELIAWMVGWALILEYAVAAGAVSVGWSGYVVGLIEHTAGIDIPNALVRGPFDGGIVNLPAMLIASLVTWLLVIGTRESAVVNSVLVVIKVTALSPEMEAAAKGCKIPALYATIGNFQRLDVTSEEVMALVPSLDAPAPAPEPAPPEPAAFVASKANPSKAPVAVEVPAAVDVEETSSDTPLAPSDEEAGSDLPSSV